MATGAITGGHIARGAAFATTRSLPVNSRPSRVLRHWERYGEAHSDFLCLSGVRMGIAVVAPNREEVVAMIRVASRPVHVPQVVHPPGHDLLDGVDAALGELDHATVDPATAHLLDLILRDALAAAAASGDTCRLADGATAVRQARKALRTGAFRQARESLLAARAALG